MNIILFALIPGIWEEIAFRGVLLNLYDKKYKPILAIIMSGLFFGLFHYINFLDYWDLEYNFLYITSQVIYASCLGLFVAYFSNKTKTLISAMVCHFSFNFISMVFYPVIFHDPIGNYALIITFRILFVGIIPWTISIFILYLVFKKTGLIKRFFEKSSQIK